MTFVRVLFLALVPVMVGCEHLRIARVDTDAYVVPGYDGTGRVVGVLDASSGMLTDMQRFTGEKLPAARREMGGTTMVPLEHIHDFSTRRDGSYADTFYALSVKMVVISDAPSGKKPPAKAKDAAEESSAATAPPEPEGKSGPPAPKPETRSGPEKKAGPRPGEGE